MKKMNIVLLLTLVTAGISAPVMNASAGFGRIAPEVIESTLNKARETDGSKPIPARTRALSATHRILSGILGNLKNKSASMSEALFEIGNKGFDPKAPVKKQPPMTLRW